jgi:hypothetical protein
MREAQKSLKLECRSSRSGCIGSDGNESSFSEVDG